MADMLMPLQIQRQYASSLDADYEFATLEELKEYATTSALSYSGQVLYCKADDTLYKVNADKTGIAAIGGDTSYSNIIDDENIDTNSTWSSKKIKGEVGSKVYTHPSDLGLDRDTATVDDVRGKLQPGEMFIANTEHFVKCKEIFPYEIASDTAARIIIIRAWAPNRDMVRWEKRDGTKMATGVVGTDGSTAYMLGWKFLAMKDDLSSCGKTYTTLDELGLTADVTFQDVVDTLPEGGSALLGVKEFTNYQTIFPYEEGNDQFARVHIVKGVANGSSTYARWFRKDGVKEAIAIFNINDNKFGGWRILKDQQIYTSLTELGLTADATIDNVRDALKVGESCIIRTDAFTDLTQFNGIQWGYLKITTTINGMSDIWLNDVTSPNGLYYGRQSSGKFYKWVGLSTQRTYTELVQLGLTADATVDDVLSTLQPGETFTAGVTQFTNYQTLFPYDSSNDQYSRVFIQQGTSLATAYIKWFRKDGSREALGNLDNNNKLRGWNEHTMNEIIHTSLTESLAGITTTLDLINALITEYRAKHKPVRFISGGITKTQLTDLPSNYGLLDITVAGYDLVEVRFAQSEFGFKKMYYGYLNRTSSEALFSSLNWGEVNTGTTTTLVANASTLKLDVTKKNSSWYGAIKLTYLFDTSLVEAEIDFRSATDTLKWTVSKGQKYIKKITYTQDANNKAHYTIGIEFSGTTYGCYQAEVIGGFADINSLTGDAFTGDTTAVYGNPYGKNNGVTLVSAPEDLGLTSPCTTVQLAQAMRNTFNKTITSGAIGVFNNGGSTITDAPSDYGLLHIEVFGHDRMMIRYDGIGGSTYAGSWIGQIKGFNGTFSGITWTRVDNNYSTAEQIVGTWIDGKPIYRKSCSFEINDTYISKVLETVAVDNIIKVYGSFGGGSSLMRPVPYNDRTSQEDYSGANTSSSTAYAEVFYQASDTTLRFTAKSQGSMAKAIVVVEYTKA